MICSAEGTINEHIFIGGHNIYPGYIIKGGSKNMMIEAGITIMGPRYMQAIEDFLGEKDSLNYLFVTQSHYDHLGAVSYLKHHIPSVQFGAFGRVADILQRDSVIKNMNFLSGQLNEYFKDIIIDGEENIRIMPEQLDITLKEGDIFDLGITSCEVYETPGHTKDHLSFYLPEMEILFPGEALGNPAGDGRDVKVEFVSSYSDYIASIEKLMCLKPKIIAMSHLYYYTDDDAAMFMDKSYAETMVYRKLIEQYLHSADGDLDVAKRLMVKAEYDEKGTIRMERNAYIANLGAQIKAIIESMSLT